MHTFARGYAGAPLGRLRLADIGACLLGAIVHCQSLLKSKDVCWRLASENNYHVMESLWPDICLSVCPPVGLAVALVPVHWAR